KTLELRSTRPRLERVPPEWMRVVEPAGEDVEGEPASIVVEDRLIAERGSTVGFAQVFGLHQLRVGHYGPNRSDGAANARALIHHRAHERAIVPGVWVPVTVKRGEARGGQRLVDRGEHADPGIPLRDGAGEIGQSCGETRVEKVGMAWTSSVMNK